MLERASPARPESRIELFSLFPPVPKYGISPFGQCYVAIPSFPLPRGSATGCCDAWVCRTWRLAGHGWHGWPAGHDGWRSLAGLRRLRSLATLASLLVATLAGEGSGSRGQAIAGRVCALSPPLLAMAGGWWRSLVMVGWGERARGRVWVRRGWPIGWVWDHFLSGTKTRT